MQKTWCSTKWIRRRLTNAPQFGLIVSLVFAGSLALAGTPDWLKQAAQAPLPTYPEDTDAVVLLDETLTTVSPAGEVHVTYRKAYKILRPEGRSKGILSVYFDNETQLTFLKAWSITPEHGDYEVKENAAVETAAFSEGLYADTRYKVLQIPGAQPGSVIGYEYQQKQRPFVMQTVWLFQDEIPVRRARFALELPSAWGYTAYWRNRAAVSPQQTGENRWTWELNDIEPIRSEPEMPTWRSVAEQVGVSFAPKASGPSSENKSSWAQIGRWYAQLTAGRREITPAIRDKTRELVAGVTDPMEKVRKLAPYVQHGIRYIAIEIGIGGYQPHAAQDVLAGGYGDCKDKVTLLSTMLREAGIESYYVLINADRDFVAPDFPSPLGFNHAILAIRLPRASDVPVTCPTLQHEKLGTLLFFDPTDSSTPLGYLPPSLQSNYGLLVTDAEGELLKLPLSPPGENRLLRVAELSLDGLGNLKGSVEEVRKGPSATALRERLLDLPNKQRQKVIQNMLADLVDGAVLTSAGVSGLNEFDGSLSLSYHFTVHSYAEKAGKLFLLHSCVLGGKTRDLLEGKPRKLPVAFSHPTSESDVIDISLPTEYVMDEMPQAVKYDYPFAAYKSETKVAEHGLHYSRTYEVKDVEVPVQQLEDLKKFFREIADDERAYTILKLP
jgi:transglutaminase-like putative cysteine protease